MHIVADQELPYVGSTRCEVTLTNNRYLTISAFSIGAFFLTSACRSNSSHEYDSIWE